MRRMARLDGSLVLGLFWVWLLAHQPAVAQAAAEEARGKTPPDLIFSTTFDCPEWVHDWEHGQGGPKIKGMEAGGNWMTRNGSREQITADANHPSGGGGKGQRHWNGDGTNSNSGGLRIVFDRQEPELWIRWYMRYEKGFRWKNNRVHYDKILYIWSAKEDKGGCQIIPEWRGDELCICGIGGGDALHCSKPGTGWQAVMKGDASDGKWHCYEIHIKVSSEGKRDGTGELWIDGQPQYSFKDASFPGKGWAWILVGSNQNCPDNGRDMYVDFDDIAISGTSYIGPIPHKPRELPQELPGLRGEDGRRPGSDEHCGREVGAPPRSPEEASQSLYSMDKHM